MSFNPDPLKQAQEVIFSRKRNKPHHPDIIFNGNPVKKSSYQRHLGMFLDSKLDFDEQLNLPALFVNSEIFYRDHPLYKSINLLLHLT